MSTVPDNAVQTVGDRLLKLGVSPVEIQLAVPFMFIAPAGSDPDSPAIQTIVKALQRGLNAMGAGLDVDGSMGPETAQAIDLVSAPAGSYIRKTWLRLANDVLSARYRGFKLRRDIGAGGMTLGDDLAPAVPLVVGLGAVALLIWGGSLWWGGIKKARRR